MLVPEHGATVDRERTPEGLREPGERTRAAVSVMVAATGIGSGLDIEGLVTQLVAAERGPQENRIFRRETQLTSEISALGTLQGALSSVQGSLDDLSSISTFNQRSASVSGSDAVSASASTDAASGSFIQCGARDQGLYRPKPDRPGTP